VPGDDVVQVAGHPGPLGSDGGLPVQLGDAGGLRGVGTLRRGGPGCGSCPMRPQGRAGQPGRMGFDVDPLVAVIVAGEAGFWVVLGAGLVARYLLCRRTTGAVLLACTPLVDLVVLGATVLDLRGGGSASWSHGLAAAYLGISVAFGPCMVRWADRRFAHRFASGPPPWRPPRFGRARVRYEWREWGKLVLAWVIACAVLLGLVAVAPPGADTGQLWGWMVRLSIVLVIWFIGWPLWVTLFDSRGAEVRP